MAAGTSEGVCGGVSSAPMVADGLSELSAEGRVVELKVSSEDGGLLYIRGKVWGWVGAGLLRLG